MIVHETLGNGLVKTKSDSNKYIVQQGTGKKYSEAIDLPNKYTYTESDEDICISENETAVTPQNKGR